MRRIVLRLGLSVFVLGGVWACGEDEAARLAPPSHDVDNGDALQVDAAQSERVTADLVSDLALDASADLPSALPSAPPSAPPLPVHLANARHFGTHHRAKFLWRATDGFGSGVKKSFLDFRSLQCPYDFLIEP